MSAVSPEQVQKNKATGRGCLIGLGVFGAILLLLLIVGGVLLYKVLDSPEGRKIVSAVADTTKLTQEAMNAPGTAELRTLGCNQAMVIDTERMMAIMESFTPDAGKTKLSEKTMVTCQMGLMAKTAPSCEEVANGYLAAVPTPAGDFIVQVTMQGASKAKCLKRYSPAGVALDPE